MRGQNAELVNELQELRQQGAQPPGAALNVAWEHECYALREELAKAELDRDAYSAALAASGSGKEGAERLAKFVTDKVKLHVLLLLERCPVFCRSSLFLSIYFNVFPIAYAFF